MGTGSSGRDCWALGAVGKPNPGGSGGHWCHWDGTLVALGGGTGGNWEHWESQTQVGTGRTGEEWEHWWHWENWESQTHMGLLSGEGALGGDTGCTGREHWWELGTLGKANPGGHWESQTGGGLGALGGCTGVTGSTGRGILVGTGSSGRDHWCHWEHWGHWESQTRLGLGVLGALGGDTGGYWDHWCHHCPRSRPSLPSLSLCPAVAQEANAQVKHEPPGAGPAPPHREGPGESRYPRGSLPVSRFPPGADPAVSPG